MALAEKALKAMDAACMGMIPRLVFIFLFFYL
jgi:hypothetical protein